MGAEHRAAKVDVQHTHPCLGLGVGKRGRRNDAGVVHQDVETAECADGEVVQRPDVGLVAHIGPDERRPATTGLDAPDRLLATRFVDIGDAHGRAFPH